MTSDGEHMRRCTDCNEHGRVEERLEAGRTCMERLENGLEKLRDDFKNHVNSSFKSTIAMLVGILMCFLTGVVGIYVNSLHPQSQLRSQAEMTLLVKEITTAIKDVKE